MHCSDSISLPYSSQQMFDLVADIESYPAFLPGWEYARILDKQDKLYRTEQRLRTGPAVFNFHTKTVLDPFSGIYVSSTSSGPFKVLHIDWCFTPIAENRCQVSVEMSMVIKPGLANGALYLMLKTGYRELLPLFERRARLLYG